MPGLKRILFRLFAWGPVLLLAVLLLQLLVERFWVDAQLADPSSVAWGEGESRLTVQASETWDGEIARHVIRIQRGAETVYADEVAIDWDLWNGGFVSALQADADPEKEIVAYGGLQPTAAAPRRPPFFLDYEGGVVRVRPFEEASAKAREVAQRWTQSHIAGGATAFVLVILALIYYAFFGAAVLIVVVRRGLRSRSVGLPRS